jgi:two-component system response regulator AtoC
MRLNMSEVETKNGVEETHAEVPAAVANETTVASDVTTAAPQASAQYRSLRSLRAETEIHAVTDALEQTGWNRKRAAKLLNISYRGLLYKIQQHKITPAGRRPAIAAGEAKVS